MWLLPETVGASFLELIDMIVIKSRKNEFDSGYVICYIECVGKLLIESRNMKITGIEIATIFVAIIGVIAISLTTTALYVTFGLPNINPVVIEQPVVEQPVAEQDVVYQYTSTEPRTCDEIVGTSYGTKFVRDGIANGEIMKVEWRTEGWGETRTVWLYCPVK